MTDKTGTAGLAAGGRTVTATHRVVGRALGADRSRKFAPGELVWSRAHIRNDGTYPHRDIGDVLVVEDDLGCVREAWSFLGETFYTVEFFERAVVVIMRGREMVSSVLTAA